MGLPGLAAPDSFAAAPDPARADIANGAGAPASEFEQISGKAQSDRLHSSKSPYQANGLFKTLQWTAAQAAFVLALALYTVMWYKVTHPRYSAPDMRAEKITSVPTSLMTSTLMLMV